MGIVSYPVRSTCPRCGTDILISVNKPAALTSKVEGQTDKAVEGPLAPYIRHPYALADLACSIECDDEFSEETVLGE